MNSGSFVGVVIFPFKLIDIDATKKSNSHLFAILFPR